jgi:hypothetical protein
VRRRTDLSGVRAVGVRVVEQIETELRVQDAGHRVVDARLAYLAGVDVGDNRVDVSDVVVRHHDHVDAGVDRVRDLIGVRRVG